MNSQRERGMGAGQAGGGQGGLLRRTPIMFDDLIADLTWPHLLRVGRLALRPARVGLGFVWLIGAVLLLSLFDTIDGDKARNVVKADGLEQIALSLGSMLRNGLVGPSAARSAAVEMPLSFLEVPTALLRDHTLVTLLALPMLLAWTALFAGAVCRASACEFALGRSLSWVESLGFGLSRWRSSVGAVALPLLLLWVIAGAMALASVLFRVPGLNVLGGLGYGLVIAGSLVCATIMIAFFLGGIMLIPSVACEGSDAIDAVQHAYAYVFAKPLRLVMYSLLLIVQGLVVVTIVMGVVFLTLRIATWTAQGLGGESGGRVFNDLHRSFGESVPLVAGQSGGGGGVGGELGGSEKATSFLVKLWTVLPLGLLGGAAFSIIWTSGTLLYLAMRRVCDGQDVHEVWQSGMIDGTLAPMAGAFPTVSAASAPGSASVSDTGPADET